MTAFTDKLQNALGDKYEIHRELKGAGMSRVFVATELRLHRMVVLKVLELESAYSVAIERFELEIQVAAQLQHPNVVPVYADGTVDGIRYFTMPFVRSGSLRTLLAQRSPIPQRHALDILICIAKALVCAEAMGVLHRDIKPENILLGDGAAMLTDFGIAHAVNGAGIALPNRSGSICLTPGGWAPGTPEYVAPERADGGGPSDHRADQYSFGVVAYEMLAHVHPFRGCKTTAEMLSAHISRVPLHLAHCRPALDGALGDIVMRCLAKHPDDRFPRAAEVLNALLACAVAIEMPAKPGVSPPRGHDEHRRCLTIGVLPFVSAAESGELRAVAVAATHAVANALGRAGHRTVLRTRAHGDSRSIGAAGNARRSTLVLSGEVSHADGRARVVVSLHSTIDGAHLQSWEVATSHGADELLDLVASTSVSMIGTIIELGMHEPPPVMTRHAPAA